jgi:hypothetical protein
MLAKILGHSSLAMIHCVYTHFSPSDEHQALAKLLMTEDD